MELNQQLHVTPKKGKMRRREHPEGQDRKQAAQMTEERT